MLQPALTRLTSDAPVINVAGRQRMLSQKLSKTALALLTVTEPNQHELRRKELESVLQEWTRAHRGLQNGDKDFRLPGINSAAVTAAFADLEPHYVALVEAANELLSDEFATMTNPSAKPSAKTAVVQKILTHENAFLTRMHAIVGLYEAESRQHVAQLKTLGLLIMSMILGTLLIVQFVVVRPAVQMVGREFEHSEAQYQRLVESMSDGLVVHDAQERVQFANQRFCEMVGYSSEELLGAPAALFVADGNRRRYDEFCRTSAGTTAPTEITLRHRDGRLIETLAFPQPLNDPEGNPQGFMLILTDITVRRQVEQRNRELAEQLAHADRLKSMGELAAGLAHEINQPLGAIANYAEGCLATIASTEGADQTLREPLQRILNAAIRGGEIIRRVRGFTQFKPHAVSLTQINDLVTDMAQLCSTEARSKGIEVRLELDPETPPSRMDAIQIQQVLANLIQNAFAALESTPAYRRRLTIRTTRTPDAEVELLVSDTGCGIAADDLSRVFEPFYSTRQEGTGLGLAIARSIVEAHGGVITAEANPDGGATFRCRLPADGPPEIEPAFSADVPWNSSPSQFITRCPEDSVVPLYR